MRTDCPTCKHFGKNRRCDFYEVTLSKFITSDIKCGYYSPIIVDEPFLPGQKVVFTYDGVSRNGTIISSVPVKEVKKITTMVVDDGYIYIVSLEGDGFDDLTGEKLGVKNFLTIIYSQFLKSAEDED